MIEKKPLYTALITFCILFAGAVFIFQKEPTVAAPARGFASHDSRPNHTDSRSSFIAQQLLSTKIKFTEREFREISKILESNPALMAKIRSGDLSGERLRELEAVLGNDRYNVFIKTNNPDYRLLRSVLGSSGSVDLKLDAAYAVVTQARQELTQVTTSSGPFSRDAKEAQLEIMARRDLELARLLGTEAAGRFSMARTMPSRAAVASRESTRLLMRAAREQ